ncbi:hypothetical protein [Amphibacillus indicireducens]|uniref:Uncharacterized protein n=1 Tax=Amphibacillus indicireducens TaxID=1076330 RepID=A0ABP7V1H2_9BACI
MAIGEEKVAIEEIRSKCVKAGLSNTMIDRITTFREFAGDSLVFGRRDITKYFSFSYSNAGKIIASMRKANILVNVVGEGKGKYRFKL